MEILNILGRVIMKFKIILTIALFSPFLNAEQVKIENPLKKNFFMMVINDGLSLSKKSGEYVHEIKLAGECARDTLKHLHTLSNCKTKPELEILYKSLNKEVTDLVSKEEAILKQEIFNNVKKQLIDPRQKFFEMLLEHATYLKEPVRLSLSTVKTIDLEASILLKLLDVKADEAIIFLNISIF